jgi:hypothetical protein
MNGSRCRFQVPVPVSLYRFLVVAELLPPKVCEIRNRETRLSGDKFYNVNCRTQRFKNSAIVYGVEQYNSNNS